jgi:hypothetical protein
VESGDKTTVPITLSVRNSGWRMVVTISGFDTRKSVEIEGSVYSGAPLLVPREAKNIILPSSLSPAGDKEEGRMMFLASLGTNNGGLPIQA